MQVDLIVASPLIRTLETAAGVFGQSPDAQPAGSISSPGVWMREIQDEQGKQAAMTQINLPQTPVIAHEDCRETIGVRCDRSCTSHNRQQLLPWPLHSAAR